MGLILGLCLSAVFALPAMTENRFVRVDQWYGGRYAWGGDFVEFFQLFSPRWGFGASVPGPDDDVSFQLGVVPVVLSLAWRVAHPARRPSVPSLRERARERDLAPAIHGAPPGRLFRRPDRRRRLSHAERLGAAVAGAAPGAPGPVPLAAADPDRRLDGLPVRRRGHRRPRRDSGAGWTLPTLILVALLILGSLPYMQRRDVRAGGIAGRADALPAVRRRDDRLDRLGARDPDLVAHGRLSHRRRAAHLQDQL